MLASSRDALRDPRSLRPASGWYAGIRRPETSPESRAPRSLAPRRLVPGMAWRPPLARVCLSENPGEFKLPPPERWVAFQNLLFGRALFEHARDFVDTDSGPANAGFAASNIGIFNDHSSGLFKFFHFGPDFLKD